MILAIAKVMYKWWWRFERVWSTGGMKLASET
jgi:hypothetical protein